MKCCRQGWVAGAMVATIVCRLRSCVRDSAVAAVHQGQRRQGGQAQAVNAGAAESGFEAQVACRVDQVGSGERLVGRQAQLVRQCGGVGGHLVKAGNGAQGGQRGQ